MSDRITRHSNNDGTISTDMGRGKAGPSGRCDVIDGDLWFEVIIDGKSAWLPDEPDKVYARTGEWRGWCAFLGHDDIDKVTEGMTADERAVEIQHVINNRRREKRGETKRGGVDGV